FAGTRETTEDEVHDPFDVGRLLMLGLLTAVVAHYVEIHFGIASASTRVHFFVYLAMILLIGHLLPEKEEEDLALDAAPTFRGGRARGRRRMGPDRPGWLSPALAVAFILTVMLGILGYEFMNYARPADLQISSISDVPSAGDILHQAFFLHPGQDFRDSPFIFLLIILTWILGTLAFVSEMVKLGLLKVQPGRERRQDAGNRQTAGIIFVGLLLAGVGARLLGDEATAGTTVLLGSALLLIWGALCLFAAVRLFLKHEPAQETAGIVAALGFATSIPVMVAGAGFYGLLMFAGCGFILYLLWKESWNGWILPGLTIAALSLTIGLSFAYLQAAQIRQAVFFGPQVQNTVSDVERVLLTTDMFASFLTIFYMFLIGLMLLAAFVLAGGGARRVRELGSTAGFVSAAILFILALGIVNTTNMQIIQADIVYKQARPLDQQATRAGNPTLWDVPIAIYEHAIELAPQEDFYYLFLGRAYLEKSAGVQDPAIQQDLLETARDRLLLAQEINPLNTDHTANLARLTTRWASLESVTEPERKSLLAEAERYYQDALALSPQNSVIRNEYANLLATLDGDCEASIDVYEQSLEIDPFFPDTYFNLANIYNICAAQLVDADVAGAADGVEAADYYRRAAKLLEEGLARERRPTNTETVLVQAGELYQQAGEYEAAIAALQEAQANGNNQVPRWNIDFRLASIYLAMGDQERALDLARDALAAAPADAHPQIQTFIEQIGEQ
ncbi:MAG: hypothetical protein R3272_10710, partial [Candidatus Promineifilaceae bacterium]|nr:hypothetical protein [Candidatus Promineifilaceae bacterium]